MGKILEIIGGILFTAFVIGAIVYFVGLFTGNETLAAAGGIAGSSYYLGLCCVAPLFLVAIKFKFF